MTLRQTQVLAAAGLALAVLLWAPRPAPADESLTGQLLVAGPNLADPNFSRAVVFMLRHDRSGALGLVVNRPMGTVPLDRLLQALESAGDGEEPELLQPEPGESADGGTSLPVFYGGPVEPFLGFTLHSRDVMLENSVPVDEQTALNVQDDALQALAEGAGPHQMIFVLGYSGWGPGQLENELERGDWYVVEADPGLIFSEEPSRTWERAVARFSTEL
jgi:putative transcriptional regulator